MSMIKYTLALVCSFMLVSLLVNGQSSSPSQKPAANEPEPIDFFNLGGPYFAMGRDCPEGEVAKPGVIPTCEPTCRNPRPVCIKLYSGDFTPCFCQEPKVRDERTKKCVDLSECPKQNSTRTKLPK